METDDLERVTDELVAGVPGCYSEKQLARKIRDQGKHQQPGPMDLVADALYEAAVNDICEAANFTAMEDIVFRLMMRGMNPNAISVMLGLSRSTVRGRANSVKSKVKALPDNCRWWGWYWAYVEDVYNRATMASTRR